MVILAGTPVTYSIVHPPAAYQLLPVMWTWYVLTKSTISARDVEMISGLLPIFLYGCEIKSGSGLGTRLGYMWLLRVTD